MNIVVLTWLAFIYSSISDTRDTMTDCVFDINSTMIDAFWRGTALSIGWKANLESYTEPKLMAFLLHVAVSSCSSGDV